MVTSNLTEEINVSRSSIQRFYGVLKFDFPFSFTIIHSWKIELLNEEDKTVAEEIFLNNNPTLRELNLLILANSLNFGLYRISFNVNITTENSEFFSYEKNNYIKVVPSGLFVSAFENGLDSLTIGLAQSLEINPSKHSYDMDKLVGINSIVYKFYCRSIFANESNSKFPNSLFDLSSIKLKNLSINGTCFNSHSNIYNFIHNLRPFYNLF